MGSPAVVTKLTSGDVTTASASFVDLTGATVTASCGSGGVILVIVIVMVTNNADGNSITMDLAVDGTRVGGGTFGLMTCHVPQATDKLNYSLQYVAKSLTAGSHTFKLQWLAGGGTNTAFADTNIPLIIAAKEIT